jgi:hypothetical protein
MPVAVAPLERRADDATVLRTSRHHDRQMALGQTPTRMAGVIDGF